MNYLLSFETTRTAMKTRSSHLLHWFPARLIFNPEDGSDRCLRNVGTTFYADIPRDGNIHNDCCENLISYMMPVIILRCCRNVLTVLSRNDRGIQGHTPGSFYKTRIADQFFYCCVHSLPLERAYRAESSQEGLCSKDLVS
jgi:hypothetical protein